MRDQPYEKYLRDIRIFPIFEGANDVMRAFIALAGMKPLGDELKELGGVSLADPIGSIGVLAEYVAGRIAREVSPDRITRAHDELDDLAGSVSEQVKRLRVGHRGAAARAPRRRSPSASSTRSGWPRAVSDIYAQVAVLSRVTAHLDEHGVEPSGQERYICDTFCRRAAARVTLALDQVERNDDERMVAIAKLAYKRGEYGYAFFED